jgi:hypothetical protein
MRINRKQLKQLVLEEIENSRINEDDVYQQRVGPEGDPLYARHPDGTPMASGAVGASEINPLDLVGGAPLRAVPVVASLARGSVQGLAQALKPIIVDALAGVDLEEGVLDPVRDAEKAAWAKASMPSAHQVKEIPVDPAAEDGMGLEEEVMDEAKEDPRVEFSRNYLKDMIKEILDEDGDIDRAEKDLDQRRANIRDRSAALTAKTINNPGEIVRRTGDKDAAQQAAWRAQQAQLQSQPLGEDEELTEELPIHRDAEELQGPLSADIAQHAQRQAEKSGHYAPDLSDFGGPDVRHASEPSNVKDYSKFGGREAAGWVGSDSWAHGDVPVSNEVYWKLAGRPTLQHENEELTEDSDKTLNETLDRWKKLSGILK